MKTTLLPLATLLLIVTSTCAVAQEPTYNYDPTHKIGETLWTLPISGQITASDDGKKLLVASRIDSVFYLVDVENVTYKRLQAEAYFGGDLRTFFEVSNNLELLIEQNTFEEGVRVWDLNNDSLLFTVPKDGVISGISHRYNCFTLNEGIYNATDGTFIKEFAGGRYTWFDDEHGVFYGSVDGGIQEYDANTKEVIRGWMTDGIRCSVRRPTNSDWIYAYYEQAPDNGPNHVDAINVVSGDRFTYERYATRYQDEQPNFRGESRLFQSHPDLGIAGGSVTYGRNQTWKFNAAIRTSQVFVNPTWTWVDDQDTKSKVFSPDLGMIYHSWVTTHPDSSILVCSVVIPVRTSVNADVNTTLTETPTCTFTNFEPAIIYNALGRQISVVSVENETIAPSQLEALPLQPLWAVQGECVKRVR